MQTKNFKILFSFTVFFLVTLACGFTSTEPAPGFTAPSQPGVGPTILPADTCPTETADLKLLMNAEAGYCLLYPAGLTLIPPRLIVINPINAPGDMPGDAWVDMNVEAAADRTAAQAADDQIAAAGEGFNITRSEILVGGLQAVVVDGLPGPDPWRKVFIVSHDRLYTFNFMPWVPNTADPTPLEKLYATVIETLHFLPPPTP